MIKRTNSLKGTSVIAAVFFLAIVGAVVRTTGQEGTSPRGEPPMKVGVSCGRRSSPANLSGDPHMRKEPNVAFGREAFALEQHLDKLGANGWELVAVQALPLIQPTISNVENSLLQAL